MKTRCIVAQTGDPRKESASPIAAALAAELELRGRASGRAYLVRLWPTRRGGMADYRVVLQSVVTGECRHFASLEGLLAFWRAARASEPGDQPGPPESGEE